MRAPERWTEYVDERWARFSEGRPRWQEDLALVAIVYLVEP